MNIIKQAMALVGSIALASCASDDRIDSPPTEYQPPAEVVRQIQARPHGDTVLEIGGTFGDYVAGRDEYLIKRDVIVFHPGGKLVFNAWAGGRRASRNKNQIWGIVAKKIVVVGPDYAPKIVVDSSRFDGEDGRPWHNNYHPIPKPGPVSAGARGLPGSPGREGGRGSDASPGQDIGTLFVLADQIVGEPVLNPVVRFQLIATGARGGQGANGSNGQDGGEGGDGGTAAWDEIHYPLSPCQVTGGEGGRGGRAGRGASGSNGGAPGHGGHVVIGGSDQAASVLLTSNISNRDGPPRSNDPSNAGRRGSNGRPGEGGRGGSAAGPPLACPGGASGPPGPAPPDPQPTDGERYFSDGHGSVWLWHVNIDSLMHARKRH